jgi:hypothetical protein
MMVDLRIASAVSIRRVRTVRKKLLEVRAVLRDFVAKSLGVGARHPRIQISECRISTLLLPGLWKSTTCTSSGRALIDNFNVVRGIAAL